MTIHTKWMELLRSEATEAFQYGELTASVGASFIDGQIKLMKSESVLTWADFIYSKFTSTIMRHFLLYGCTTVVLAFDDKRFVPRAKAITQCKRRSGVQIIDFDESSTLPNDLPVEWKESIMNSWFKHRVIELICTNVPRLVAPPKGCSLIVDWETTREYVYGDAEAPEIKDHGCAEIGEVCSLQTAAFSAADEFPLRQTSNSRAGCAVSGALCSSRPPTETTFRLRWG